MRGRATTAERKTVVAEIRKRDISFKRRGEVQKIRSGSFQFFSDFLALFDLLFPLSPFFVCIPPPP